MNWQSHWLGKGGGALGILMLGTLGALALIDTRKITLESKDGRRTTRSIDIGRDGTVYLIKRLSDAPCTQNRTWGYNEREIWVDRGCRATFEIYRPDFSDLRLAEGQFVLESKDGRRTTRNMNTERGIHLVRQLSESPCTKGKTWNFDKNKVWVDKGCRAVFEVIRKGNNRPQDEIRDGYEDDRWLYVLVESVDGRRVSRHIPRARAVMKFRQYSDQPCVFGKTWGNTNDSIWVDRGCRALFKVRKAEKGGKIPPGQLKKRGG